MARQVSRSIWGLAFFCFHYQRYVVEPVRLTPKDTFRIVGLCSSSPSRIAGPININIITPASLVAPSAVVLIFVITINHWHQRKEGNFSSQSLKPLTGTTIVAYGQGTRP